MVYFPQCLITQPARSPTWSIPARSLLRDYGRGVANLRYSLGWAERISLISETRPVAACLPVTVSPGLHFLIVLVTESYAPDFFTLAAFLPRQASPTRAPASPRLHLPADPCLTAGAVHAEIDAWSASRPSTLSGFFFHVFYSLQ